MDVETLADRSFQASSSFYPGKENNELALWLGYRKSNLHDCW